jgi:hypothetical protein
MQRSALEARLTASSAPAGAELQYLGDQAHIGKGKTARKLYCRRCEKMVASRRIAQLAEG